jgi:predicted TIM-barrel fold metal-dependent hydrolase
MPRFDSIVHATSDGLWLGKSRHDASVRRMLHEMDRAEIDCACLVGIADFIPNEFVLETADLYPDRLIPIAGLNPAAYQTPVAAAAAVAELADRRFAGIKLHPRLNEYDPLDARCLAAIDAAGGHGLPVFLDTMFRQASRATRSPAEIVDAIAVSCRSTRIVLLHGGAAALLDLFELVRMHAHLLLDLSCTILRYAGSSLDADLRFVMTGLDQRVCIGSDFPEYTPADAFARTEELFDGLPTEKRERILFSNLADLFSHWHCPADRAC